MQFTVLIEFLVPGLATTLLLLYIYLGGTMPTLHAGQLRLTQDWLRLGVKNAKRDALS